MSDSDPPEKPRNVVSRLLTGEGGEHRLPLAIVHPAPGCMYIFDTVGAHKGNPPAITRLITSQFTAPSIRTAEELNSIIRYTPVNSMITSTDSFIPALHPAWWRARRIR